MDFCQQRARKSKENLRIASKENVFRWGEFVVAVDRTYHVSKVYEETFIMQGRGGLGMLMVGKFDASVGCPYFCYKGDLSERYVAVTRFEDPRS